MRVDFHWAKTLEQTSDEVTGNSSTQLLIKESEEKKRSIDILQEERQDSDPAGSKP